MKVAILTCHSTEFNGEPRPVFLRWENRRPTETWFKSFRRVYGSRGEAKRDLRRARKFDAFEGAKIVEVRP